MAHYDPDHDFAPLIRYLASHPELEHLDWQYMGSRPYRHGTPVTTYRARETATEPGHKLVLTPYGQRTN